MSQHEAASTIDKCKEALSALEAQLEVLTKTSSDATLGQGVRHIHVRKVFAMWMLSGSTRRGDFYCKWQASLKTELAATGPHSETRSTHCVQRVMELALAIWSSGVQRMLCRSSVLQGTPGLPPVPAAQLLVGSTAWDSTLRAACEMARVDKPGRVPDALHDAAAPG